MSPIRRRNAKSGRSERGQALVEFGLVATVFFLLVFGIFDMARLFESWMSIQHAAREGARYAITGQVICNGQTDNRDECIRQRARQGTAGLTGGGEHGTDVVVSFKSWDYPTYAGSGDAYSGKPCDQIEVKVRYTHHFMTPLVQVFAPSGITIYGSQRMTNEPFGECKANDLTH